MKSYSETPMGEMYVITNEGEKVIPASVRKDGSVRKPIRVRNNFIPVEERGKFQTKAAEYRARQMTETAHGPPGSTTKASLTSGAPPGSQVKSPKSATKSKKKGGKNKSSVEAPLLPTEPCLPFLPPSTPTNNTSEVVIQSSPEILEMKQKLRVARKELRDINSLTKKKHSGGEMSIEEEQMLERRADVTDTIAELRLAIETAELKLTNTNEKQ